MAKKLKKIEVIAALKEKGIAFPEDAKYKELYKLLKAGNKFQNLKIRAAKIGMSPEMIETYPDAESLKKACDKISPSSNKAGRAKYGPLPKPVQHPEPCPDKFEIESRLETRLSSTNREQHDEVNLQSKLRWINCKYGAQKPERIIRDASNIPVDGKDRVGRNAKVFVTKYTIIMKG